MLEPSEIVWFAQSRGDEENLHTENVMQRFDVIRLIKILTTNGRNFGVIS